jgi:hypothetical protein
VKNINAEIDKLRRVGMLTETLSRDLAALARYRENHSSLILLMDEIRRQETQKVKAVGRN